MAINNPTHGAVENILVGTDIQMGPDANLGDEAKATVYITDAVDYLSIQGNSIEAEDSTFTHNINISLVPQGTGKVLLSYGTPNTLVGFGVAGALESMPALLNGEILIGNTGGSATSGHITAGAGVTVLNTPGHITISAPGAAGGVTAFTTDGGNVIPLAGVVDVLGGANLVTSGVGNNLTIDLNGTTASCVQVGNVTGSLTSIAAGLTGQLLVGATVADPAFANIAYGNFTFSNLTPATSSSLAVTNGDGDPASDAQLLIGLSAGAGDPSINWQISATQNYAMGIDNSDSDTFKLTNSTSPSAGTELIKITNAGVITLANDLDVSEGGTGVSTLTSHGILLGNGAGDIQATAEPSDGQLLIGSSGNQPVLASLTSVGGTITITPGAGTIDLAAVASGGGLSWSEVTDATKTMVVDEGYIGDRGTDILFTLPATATVGSLFALVGKGAGKWKVAQVAGQTIHFGNQNTTTGIAGYIESTLQYDSIEFICITADTDFAVRSSIGNITVA